MSICAVKWCVAEAKIESQHCAVHQKDATIRPLMSSEAPGEPVAADEQCDSCDGTGKCADCDGEGTHMCEARNCYDEHDCRSCDGSGECQDCENGRAEKSGVDPVERSHDARYLAWAFDAGWRRPEPWGER